MRHKLWIIGICLAGVVAAGAQAWAYRHSVSSPDAISYLDIADAYGSGELRTAVNSYWSPLYSWLIAVVRGAIDPSPFSEFSLLKIINFLIFLGAFVSFVFLVQEIIRTRGERDHSAPEVQLFRIAAYLSFFWGSLIWIGVQTDTPDMLTSALLYLASALLLRIINNRDTTRTYALLGITLAVGALAKSPFFVLSSVFFLLALGFGRSFKRTTLAVAAFLLIAGPYFALLSVHEGRLTFGTSGKLNYAWFVSPGYNAPVHWQGGSGDFGTPLHPERQIHDDPATFEFASPVRGTYPPWYDPSYWWKGVNVRFDSYATAIVGMTNLRFYARHLGAAVVLLLLLLALSGKFDRQQAATTGFVLLVISLAGLGLYMLAKTHTSMRYIGPFAVLLYTGCLTMFSMKDRMRFLTIGAVLATAALAAVLMISFVELTGQPGIRSHDVARQLHQMGIKAGDPVCIVGDEDEHVAWARIARVKIAAQMPAEREARLPHQLVDRLHDLGIRAIISNPHSNLLDARNWKQIGDTEYRVFLLD